MIKGIILVDLVDSTVVVEVLRLVYPELVVFFAGWSAAAVGR